MIKKLHVISTLLLIGTQSAFAMEDNHANRSITDGNEQYAIGWNNKSGQKGTTAPTVFPTVIQNPFNLTSGAFRLVCNSQVVNVVAPGLIFPLAADCGAGSVAIAGTSDCDTNPALGDAIVASCISANATTCTTNFAEFFLTKCNLIAPGATTVTSCALCVPTS